MTVNHGFLMKPMRSSHKLNGNDGGYSLDLLE